MRKILYEDKPSQTSYPAETLIYQEDGDVIFEHTGMTDETGHDGSFRREVSVELYRQGIEKLKNTGQCDLSYRGMTLKLEVRKKVKPGKTERNLEISYGGGWLIIPNFTLDVLVLQD